MIVYVLTTVGLW